MRMRRGRRESHWLVVRRCLAIIRRAQRGPATRAELMQAVLHEVGADAYGEEADEEARRIRLEKDLERIRTRLLVNLYFDRRMGRYVIQDLWMPLLDLPDEDLETIAWLEETFGPESPHHDAVHGLLGRLRSWLSPERLAAIERHRAALEVDLQQRDEDEIPAAVWEGLRRALAERRRVTFLYHSPGQEDGVPRRHVVDPYEWYFDVARGHYYLRGWCHYTEGPPGRYEQHRYFHYRLGRIRDLRVLPNKLPPIPPSAPRYEVVYELVPKVARLGVTRLRGIEVERVERREDGGALVRGWTESLFWAVQALLHYGPNCRVLGGPEMVREMRRVVEGMAGIYRVGE